MTCPYPDFDAPDGVGFEYDDAGPGPTVEQIRRAVEKGLICASCGEEFVKAHGYRVACRFCFGRMTEAEVAAEEVRLATHEEGTAAAFKRRARNKRKDRAAKGVLTDEGLQIYNKRRPGK